MEISNEIKTKIFAQYIGRKVQVTNEKYIDNGYIGTIMGVCSVRGILVEHPCGSDGDENINDCKLVLKPLSSITKEDAIKVAKMQVYRYADGRRTNMYEHHTVFMGENAEDYVKSLLINSVYFDEFSVLVYQYLQERGYDLVQRLLGGETIQKSGLAI